MGMRKSNLVLLLSVLLAIAFWIVDAFVQHYFFEDPLPIIDHLIFNIHSDILYSRILILLFFTSYGLFARQIMHNHQSNFEALEGYKKYLATILNSIQDIVIATDTKGRINGINPAAEELIGMNIDKAKYQRITSVLKIIKNDDGISCDTIIERFLSGEESGILSKESIIETSQGEMRNFIFNATPLRDLDNNMIGVVFALKDITDQKMEEEKVIENEQKFRSFFEHSNDGIHMIDNDGIITEWNNTLEKITGINSEEAVGNYEWEIRYKLNPEFQKSETAFEDYKKQLLVALKTGQGDFLNRKVEKKMVDPSGRTVYYEEQTSVLPRKSGFWLANITRDVSDYRRSLHAIQENQKHFETLFYNSPIGNLIVSERGEILEFNGKIYETLGYNRNDFALMNLNNFKVVDGKPILSSISHGDHDQIESKILNTNGDALNFIIQSQPSEYFGQKAIYLSLIEITELKSIQQNLANSEDKFYKTFMMSPDIIILSRQEDNLVLDVNDGFVEQTGYYRDDIIGHQLDQSIWSNLEDRDKFLNEIQTHDSAKQFEARLNKANGDSFYASISSSTISINNETVLLSYIRDITQSKNIEDQLRKAFSQQEKEISDRNQELEQINEDLKEEIIERAVAEERFRQSEDRYRSLFRTLRDIYFRVDLNGSIQELSPSIVNSIGYTNDELLGKRIQSFARDRSFIDVLLNTIMKSRSLNNFTMPVKSKDNQEVFLSVNCHFFLDENNKIAGIEGIARDITSDIQYEKFITALYGITKAVNSTNTLDELFSAIYHSISDVINTKNFFIAIYNEAKGKISFPFFIDEMDDKIGDLNIADPYSHTAKVIREGRPIILKKEYLDQRAIDGPTIGSVAHIWLGVPLKVQDKTVGAIAVQSYTSEKVYSEKDLDVMSTLSDQIALAIDRKSTQIQINSQFQFLQNLIDTIPHPVFYKDSEKRLYEGCNKAFEELIGMDKKDILAKSTYDIYDRDTALKYDNSDIETLTYDKTLTFEQTIFDTSGDPKEVIFYKSTYKDNHGETAGIVGTIIDVTAMKEVQKKLNFARERAEQIYRVTPSCIFTIDKQRRVTSWNDRVAQLTGFTAEEVIGTKCPFCPSDHDCGILDPTKNKPVIGKEATIKTKDGQTRIISKNFDLLRDPEGTVIGGIESFEDITQRKKIEEALYWQAGINSSMAELSRAIFSIHSIDQISELLLQKAIILTESKRGIIAYVDQSSGNIKLSASKPTTDIEIEFWQNDIDSKDSILSHILKNKIACVSNNIQADFNGTFPEHDFSRFVAVPAMTFKETLGIVLLADSRNEYTDKELEITERISSLLSLFVQRFRAENDIRQALNKQQELNDLKSRFISMISHEYRTPLTAIVLSTELLKDYGDKLNEENKNQQFERIEKSIKGMNNLLEDIIDYSKLDVGKVKFSPGFVDINQLSMEIQHDMEYYSNNKCKIKLTVNNNNMLISLDEKLIRKILNKLLSNAIKFSKSDCIIKFNVDIQENAIEFNIKDRGQGIPDEDVDKIFDPFHRSNKVETTPGTGLGLAIVKNSVEIHGGSISFTTEEGAGSSFTVRIPLSESAKFDRSNLSN
jgi:PAS domain S-box-containing protein